MVQDILLSEVNLSLWLCKAPTLISHGVRRELSLKFFGFFGIKFQKGILLSSERISAASNFQNFYIENAQILKT